VIADSPRLPPPGQAASVSLRRKSRKRLVFGNIDRLVFAGLCRVAPGVLDAHRPASQLPHECRSAGRTMDATDTGAPETRYCGRSQALLYNDLRTHRSLDKDAPFSRPVQRIGRIRSHALVGGLHHCYMRV
jgi:hypothetical protein